MDSLNTKPGSSTPRQRCKLHQIKRRKGWSDDEFHDAIGAESTTLLSSLEASEAIVRLSGVPLPNPPGQKPSPYKGKPHAVRMITRDHVEQIAALGWRYFQSTSPFMVWLTKHFKLPFVQPANVDSVHETIRQLGTAKRAGEVIVVLKQMHARRSAPRRAAQCRDRKGAAT